MNDLGAFLNNYVGTPSGRGPVQSTYGNIADIPMRWPRSSQSTSLQLQRAVGGVGFHGALIHGCVLCIADAGQATELDALIETRFLPDVASGERTWQTLSAMREDLPETFLLMRPGEVIRFAQPFRGGLALRLCTSDLQTYTQVDADTRTGRQADPLIRLYPPGSPVPDALPWCKVPYYTRLDDVLTADPRTAGDPGSCNDDWLSFPDGTTHVCLSFWDDAAYNQPGPGIDYHEHVVSGETGSYEVWWRMAPMAYVGGEHSFVHHHDDDFDSAGRGEVSHEHTTEWYEVPEGCDGILVRQVSGDDFYHSIVATQTGRR
jgi:hypothetical protein